MKSCIRICLSIILTLCILLCASCKGGTGENEIIIPSATAPVQTSAPVSRDTKGKLILPIPENAVRDNPYSVTTEEMLTMYSLIFEPLLGIDDAGRLVPMLAQSWMRGEHNDNVWTINLRSNVLWHDGTAFTADDVLFSYNTLRSYLASENASLYYDAYTKHIDSIEVIDISTVSVKFSSSGYNALYALTFPVVCKSAYAANPLCGTGAYAFSAQDDKSVTLGINKTWWKELPHISTIRFEERLNNETALASYKAGQLNFVPTSNLSAGKYRKDGDTTVYDVMTQDAEMLIFNYSNELLYDMNIRKAIAYSLDRSKLITNVYMNRAQTCDVPVAPDSWLYSSQYTTIEYNVDKACTLLENAGYRDSDGDGFREKDGISSRKLEFRLLVSDTTDNTARKNAAEQIKTMLQKCGIDVTIAALPYTLGNDDSSYIKALSSGDFDLALVGVHLGQDGDLCEFFRADGTLNFGHVSDDALLSYTLQINDAPDETAMRDTAYEFQSAFVDKLPFLVLYFRLDCVVCSYEIKGIGTMREPTIMYNTAEWYIE